MLSLEFLTKPVLTYAKHFSKQSKSYDTIGEGVGYWDTTLPTHPHPTSLPGKNSETFYYNLPSVGCFYPFLLRNYSNYGQKHGKLQAALGVVGGVVLGFGMVEWWVKW